MEKIYGVLVVETCRMFSKKNYVLKIYEIICAKEK